MLKERTLSFIKDCILHSQGNSLDKYFWRIHHTSGTIQSTVSLSTTSDHTIQGENN